MAKNGLPAFPPLSSYPQMRRPIRLPPPFSRHTPEEEQARLAAKENGDRASFVLLVAAWYGLALKISRAYAHQAIDWEDLFQEAVIGLMEGVESHEIERGVRLSTWAIWKIFGAASRARAKTRETIRLPEHVHEGIRRLRCATRDLEHVRHRAVTDEEVADKLRISVEQVRDLLRAAVLNDLFPLPEEYDEETAFPLNEELDLVEQREDWERTEPIFSANERSTRPTLHVQDQPNTSAFVDVEQDPEEAVDAARLPHDVQCVLASLTCREEKVLRMRFGLGPYEDGRTLEKIGKEFSLTRERIRGIEAKALRQLRHPSRSALVREYADGEAPYEVRERLKNEADRKRQDDINRWRQWK